jgi:hypothetical protein
MTIDKRRLPAAPGQIPAFTPVPRERQRHDGWTDARQHAFIEALADTGSVKAAAHRVNMTPEGAYLLRRHPEGASFRKAWEAALALGVQQLEDIAMERALYGTEVPVYSYGKLIGSRIVHNDRLLMFMLRNRAPTRFGADGRALARRRTIGDPEFANQLSRLKRQWRKEWEEERRSEDRRTEADLRDEVDTMIDRMRANRLAAMTSRTRALYEAYCAAEAEDQASGRTGWDEADAKEGEEGNDGPDTAPAAPTRRIEQSDFHRKPEDSE